MQKYSISQAASMLCLSGDTLRYYDKIGLVKPSRKENRYRFYTDLDLVLLQYIEVMKFTGLSLAQIGIIMRNTTQKTEDDKKATLDILKEKQLDLNRKIFLYQEAEKLLDQTIQSIDGMACPADMAQIDCMIKQIYNDLKENGATQSANL